MKMVRRVFASLCLRTACRDGAWGDRRRRGRRGGSTSERGKQSFDIVGDTAGSGKVRRQARKGRTRQRVVRAYKVAEVRAIETAATRHPSVLVRIALRNELRKIFAALRNDDSVWDKPVNWTTAGNFPVNGFLYGLAEKTKATEKTISAT